MSAGGKGHAQRPTDQAKFSSGYDNIQWTKEEDEEFDRLQDRSSTERPVAKVGDTACKEKGMEKT
jgi:hypothetical protein